MSQSLSQSANTLGSQGAEGFKLHPLPCGFQERDLASEVPAGFVGREPWEFLLCHGALFIIQKSLVKKKPTYSNYPKREKHLAFHCTPFSCQFFLVESSCYTLKTHREIIPFGLLITILDVGGLEVSLSLFRPPCPVFAIQATFCPKYQLYRMLQTQKQKPTQLYLSRALGFLLPSLQNQITQKSVGWNSICSTWVPRCPKWYLISKGV